MVPKGTLITVATLPAPTCHTSPPKPSDQIHVPGVDTEAQRGEVACWRPYSIWWLRSVQSHVTSF